MTLNSNCTTLAKNKGKMKDYTHHFDIDGLDVYAMVWYDEGQEGSYDLPYIAPSYEIRNIWIGDQQLNYGDFFDIVEERIQEELGTPE